MTFLKFLFTKSFLKQLLIAFITIIVLILVILWWLKFSTNHNQKIEVPDLAKMSLNDVAEKLDDFDLRFEILDSANYNPDYPKYSVIEQIPMCHKVDTFVAPTIKQTIIDVSLVNGHNASLRQGQALGYGQFMTAAFCNVSKSRQVPVMIQ